MRRQVWDITSGPDAGGSVAKDERGEVCLIRPLTATEVVAYINAGNLTARREDAPQDPVADLVRHYGAPGRPTLQVL